jgi:hypothetical protein
MEKLIYWMMQTRTKHAFSVTAIFVFSADVLAGLLRG